MTTLTTGPQARAPGLRPAQQRATEAMASYDGATLGRGGIAWMPSQLDPRYRYVPQFDLARMRDRARSLQRNNAIAAGLLRTFANNVIGTGFSLQPTTADPEWNKRALGLMENWFPSADAAGLSWLEHQHVAFTSACRDGDVASVLLSDGTLQLLEGDLIASQPGKSAGTVDGVTLGPNGRPAAFTFRTVGLDGKWTWQTVGAVDVMFLARRTRAGQIRGEPVQCSTFDLYDQLDEWIEALLMAARSAACAALVVTRDDARGAVRSISEADRLRVERERNAGGPGCSPCDPGAAPPPRPPEMRMAPGQVWYQKPGDKVEQISPTQPAHNFPEILKIMLRLIGLPMGLPLEWVLLDYTGVSGPTARASMNAANHTFGIQQKWFADSYLRRAYHWRMSKFIKAGLIEYRSDFFNHRWVTPRRPMLDPKGDLLARQLAFDTGETTLTEQLQLTGHDLATYIATRKAEIDAMNAAGIPVLHSASLMVGDGIPGTPAPAPKPVDGDEVDEADDENEAAADGTDADEAEGDDESA